MRDLEALMPVRVIWQSGTKLVAWRGKDYVKPPPPAPRVKGPRLSMAEQAAAREAAAAAQAEGQAEHVPLDLNPEG